MYWETERLKPCLFTYVHTQVYAMQMKSYRQLSTVNAGTSMHQNQWLVKANGNGARLMASILRVREEEKKRV